ncbi:MAG: ABC transporter permease [Spirochaetaceae bacterium]|jgi:ABC-type uncharacterized transport system permease subunit|nr:ABC transporter permease [Spirochaetaceae bacterium]
MFDLVGSLLMITLAAGTSLLYATLGEIFTEKSGILNLGIEGTMLMSALTAFTVSYYSGSLILAVFCAALTGGLLSLIHAIITVTLRGNQVVSGLSITLLGTGLSSFLGQRLGPESNGFTLFGLNAHRFHAIEIPLLSNIPFLGAFFHQDILTYLLYFLVPATWIFLYRSRYGLSLRAVGENPRTATAMGIHVMKERYIYTVFGGIMSGIGGAHLSLAYTPGWSENITGGRGWIVIALVIFAAWNPGRAMFGALLFGGINAIQFRLQASGTNIPSAFLNMLPYLITLVVLVLMNVSPRMQRRFTAPGALGRAYVPEDK